MKNGKTVVAIALALGLAATSLGVRAQEEGGTGVGTPHEEGGTTGEHKTHHRTRGAHAHRGMKKGVKSKGVDKKTGVSGQGASAEHQHGYGSMPESGHEEMEEGSH